MSNFLKHIAERAEEGLKRTADQIEGTSRRAEFSSLFGTNLTCSAQVFSPPTVRNSRARESRHQPGSYNPTGRHDTPEEKHHDEIRAAINASHRFTSFADQRAENFVKW